MWAEITRWRGVILIALAVVATIVLAFGNQLVLYIHPRYIVFTIVMGIIALLFVVASVVIRRGIDHEQADRPRRVSVVLSVVGVTLAAAIAVSMIALPPATLTSATATQRDITSTTVGAETRSLASADSASSAAFASFTVVDWASLLRQTSDLTFYKGKPVDVVGFITPDPDDPTNLFYVSRFVVTCCAVDAQPTGIPVYLPNWQQTYSVDDWVRAKGSFGANSSTSSALSVVLDPASVSPVEQPGEPYLY